MGVGNWDVGILGEKIVVVAVHGAPLPEAHRIIRRFRQDSSARRHRAPHPRRLQCSAGHRGVGAGSRERRPSGTLPGGHLGRNDNSGRLCSRAQRGRSGGGHPRLYVRLAWECVYGLFHPLHLLQFEHARRHLPLRRAWSGRAFPASRYLLRTRSRRRGVFPSAWWPRWTWDAFPT